MFQCLRTLNNSREYDAGVKDLPLQAGSPDFEPYLHSWAHCVPERLYLCYLQFPHLYNGMNHSHLVSLRILGDGLYQVRGT